jgi:hypothetical protein
MTKDEALRLALEALKVTWYHVGTFAPTDEAIELYDEAITAIKAALEAKDEPVAQPEVRTGNCLRVGVCASEGHKIQPQRTWVGLTDKERDYFTYIDAKDKARFRKYFDYVEAKLKEKNT